MKEENPNKPLLISNSNEEYKNTQNYSFEDSTQDQERSYNKINDSDQLEIEGNDSGLIDSTASRPINPNVMIGEQSLNNLARLIQQKERESQHHKEYKAYKYRYVILALYLLGNILNGIIGTGFSPIPEFIQKVCDSFGMHGPSYIFNILGLKIDMILGKYFIVKTI